MRRFTLRVPDAYEGCTLYEFLREGARISDGCIRRAKRREGGLVLDGEAVWVRAPLRAGQLAEIAIDDERGSTAAPECTDLEVLFEDEDLIVVNKPAGVAMYPCAGHERGTLLNFVAGHCRQRGPIPGLHAVHRLDVGTSGVALFATSAFAKERLQQQLASGVFSRSYLAICHGVAPSEQIIDEPIGRMPDNPRQFGVVPDGKHARTLVRRLEAIEAPEVPEAFSLVRAELETGRTHQVRIHLAHIGHPILGDSAYGLASELIGRPALHSWRARLLHPLSQAQLCFEAPLPRDIEDVLTRGA